MTTKIQKWGNSLAVRLPRHTVEKLRLTAGKFVSVIPERESIKIKILKKKARTLHEMVQHISFDNLHTEVTWGPRQGKEIW